MTIKPPKKLGGGKHIPPPKEYQKDEPLHVSFKYLDLFTNNKFGLRHCVGKDNYFEKLLLRLKDLNGLRLGDFRTAKAEWRNHEIAFQKTSEPNGFVQLPEHIRENEPWQFQLTKGEHGRIHGLLVGNFFYIVWLDPCHHLYPDEKNTCNH